MATVRREVREAASALAAADPVMAEAIEDHGLPRPTARVAPSQRFAVLARAICYQQLAGQAAAAIHRRLVDLLEGDVSARAVLGVSVEQLRSCGLSGSKAASIRDLAEHVDTGDVELEQAGRWGDERLIEELTRVRGIGVWTAQMFMMTSLRRPDVWPVLDFGVRKGWSVLYELPEIPTAKELESMADHLRPHRSLVSHYCWRSVDTILIG